MSGYVVKLSEDAYWLLYDKVTEKSKKKRVKVTMKDFTSSLIIDALSE